MAAYFRPTTLVEAYEALAQRSFTILAGGTDYYPGLVGKALSDDLLDLSAITGLRGIEDCADHWRIGATTTWSDLIVADLPPLFDGLKLAAREVGGVQIQNAGTIAGNLCNASPAADGVPPLLALDARVELADKSGTENVALSDFLLGNRKTRLRPEQLLTSILIPKPAHPARSHFVKLGARKYLLISIAMVAVTLEVSDSRVSTARVAVGACSAVAQRLAALEALLIGKPCDARLGDLVADAHFSALSPIDDVRATREYRLAAAATLMRRTLAELGGRP